MTQRTDTTRTGPGTVGLLFEEPTVFEQSVPGRRGFRFGKLDVPPLDYSALPSKITRKEGACPPELTEVDVARHFTRISMQNYSNDIGVYPLGSCTMKYNPKIANRTVSLPGFARSHPFMDLEALQGNLELCSELQRYLAEISGMDAVTLWPAAGSHGELVGMMMIRAYHESHGNPRKTVLIPDSAHGTNPASAAICHYNVVPIKSDKDGLLDPHEVEKHMNEDVAAIMVTNPNTLGIFEERFQTVTEIVHAKGGLVYADGANLNALLGVVKLGKIGADVMHFNLHKTFATPHGGGGPGAGPVGVVKRLEPFLPTPIIQKNGNRFTLEAHRPQSIGRVKAFWGNFGMLVRAYTYIREYGPDGLRDITHMAVLNANYIRKRLEKTYHVPYSKPVLHECIVNDKHLTQYGVKTLDVAKRLMDYGYHPPTVYFPLIVPGAMMIEPTETESKDQIDQFCDAMIKIAEEAKTNPQLLKDAPKHTFRRRLDEVRAAREPKLKA